MADPKTDFRLISLNRQINPLRKEILNHPLYESMISLKEVRIFMEHHIYAVWDFMSLLKTLQQNLTSTDSAWTPTKDRASRKLINEIVCAEESDVDLNGNPASHYELYLDAMRQAGAETRPIIKFVQKLQEGFKQREIVRYNISESDEDCLNFIKSTQKIINRGKTHEIAAAFTFGREDLIPDMFTSIIKKMYKEHPSELSAFVYYLDRHIELDADEHGPMALKMIHNLCKDDDQKWQEVEDTSIEALKARLTFWNRIQNKL
ncbi:MAG: Uncharacterised protein [Owenweeksia sp. TMED14]|nr:MAG: Uncharacterised protein [Owenweeksia sp. TMED14]|tara:strand:- start:1341 stop:2126 length:786 start_codon:yes stop_codon:yes gene_type:complete